MNHAKSINKINLRDKGIKVTSGKLMKGCVRNAATKLCISSIPSNYESIIYKSQSKRAFGRSEKNRLQNFESLTEIQRKGSFSLISQSSQPPPQKNMKEGFGPFLSKVKREWIRDTKTPGPGKYQINEKAKKEKRRKRIHMKKQKVIKNRIKDQVPGPGSYLSENSQPKHPRNQFGSLFTSKSKRNTYIPSTSTPGPGSYLPIQRIRPKRKTIPPKEEESISENYVRLGLLRKEGYEEPGPGWYNSSLPNFKPIYERIKFSRNFISPENEEIGKMWMPSPSPTFYKIGRMYENEDKQMINWPCFMSETKRDVFRGKEVQGPTLVPTGQKKQNFHFNIKNHWL